MKKNEQASARQIAIWAAIWLAATVAGPALCSVLLWSHQAAAAGTAIMTVVLHLLASDMIQKHDLQSRMNDPQPVPNPQLGGWLIFGGWALMLGTFFIGCYSVLSSNL